MQNDKNKELSPEGQLRKGYTTGSCATAAAKAATMMLFGMDVSEVKILTPKGITLELDILEKNKENGKACCAVKKYSGDDPDVTNGVLVFAEVELIEGGDKIIIDGGTGVGRVTLPGLACKQGEAAINPVPRRTIEAEVREVLTKWDYHGGAKVTISIPEGVELASCTYNPKLGIVGGISVIGTSGIVEPMSEQALIDTIKVEMNMRKAAGAEYILITPGNYGESFVKEHFENREFYSVKCSNYIGNTLDYAEQLKIKGILFVGHIGKLVKVAAGIMNTHSKYADGRVEVLAAHAALCGAETALIQAIFKSITTDQAYEEMLKYGEKFTEDIINSLMERIEYHLNFRTHDTMDIGVIMFSNKYGLLGKSSKVEDLVKKVSVK